MRSATRDADPEDVVGVVDQEHLGALLGAQGERDGRDDVVGVDVQHHLVVVERQLAQPRRPVDQARPAVVEEGEGVRDRRAPG